ncbi:MAG: YceD family protein [Smithella sp.]
MANSLKINVFLIPEEGQSFIFSEDNAWFKACLKDSESTDFTLDRVDVNCLVTNTSGTVFIKGSFSAQIDICCSRCLENTKLSIGADFAYTLIPAKAETREDLELTPEELEISYYKGDFIDLGPIICEQIILQIPIKALCSEECKGLCPQCGANLNASSCNCHLNFVDNRMAVLKNFTIKN